MAKPLSEKDKNLHQIPVRLHSNDYRAMKKLFLDEGWTFQKFVSACVESYLARDPLLLKTIADWKIENSTPNGQSGYTLSKRERAALLDEIEGNE